MGRVVGDELEPSWSGCLMPSCCAGCVYDDGNLLAVSEPKLSPALGTPASPSSTRRIRIVSDLVSSPNHPHLSIDPDPFWLCLQSRLVLYTGFTPSICRKRDIRRPSSPKTAKRPILTPILDTKTASMRRSHRKSRNGCPQCKSRHIKVSL
jgi:hypothetical protein